MLPLLSLNSLIPLFAIAFMAAWEWRAPCRNLKTPRRVRWTNNLAFLAVKKILFHFLPLTVPAAALWAYEYHWGLLNHYAIALIPSWLLTFIVMDFCNFALHYCLHKVKWMWRLHRLHHSDTDFDVTTATRSHPLDDVLYLLLHSCVCIALGLPALAVGGFQIYAGLVSKFSHGNILLPPKIEKFLHFFVVTPGMHRIHHSAHLEETDSNYSIVISWWDHLFGTYTPQPKGGDRAMIIGLETFRETKEQRLDHLLLHPIYPNRPIPPNWQELA